MVVEKVILKRLEASIEDIKYQLVNEPMTPERRLQRVVAIDKISDALNLLNGIEIN